MSQPERLAYMANQIARNLAVQGHDRATTATAEHILAYWTQEMRAGLDRLDASTLHPIALSARDRLQRKDMAHSQAPVAGAAGASDAG